MNPDIREKSITRLAARNWSKVNRVVEKIVEDAGVAFHDYSKKCEGLECVAFIDGEPLHWDSGHMTMAGSLYYTDGMLDQNGRLVSEKSK